MPAFHKSLTFDTSNALVAATFWAAALGSDVDQGSTADKAFEPAGWGGPTIWFQRVPEAKTAKNRLHLDIRAPGALADEVARLKGLGAAVLTPGTDLVVMQDPDGNECCVE
ncbi:MAG: VOC family protein [Lapillicoccus sp.]